MNKQLKIKHRPNIKQQQNQHINNNDIISFNAVLFTLRFTTTCTVALTSLTLFVALAEAVLRLHWLQMFFSSAASLEIVVAVRLLLAVLWISASARRVLQDTETLDQCCGPPTQRCERTSVGSYQPTLPLLPWSFLLDPRDQLCFE
eukprot:m.92356 g.92356  ORF g.92356 m.92356 type:complete len:146 (+) comp12356_c0_seq14:1156-1593(+)